MSTLPLVTLVGVGGIGHPCALALARTGSVRLRFIDDDRVERSNLHRLFAFDEGDVGSLKAAALAAQIARAPGALAPEIIVDRATPETILSAISQSDVVVEGSDNFATKFLVADACALTGRPLVHGAAVGWTGTVLPVVPSRSACYRCIFEDVPEGVAVDCASAGVFAPVTALVGALMAAEALRLARGDHRRAGTLSHLDARTSMFRTRTIRARKDCPLCSEARVITAIDASRYTAPDCSLHHLSPLSESAS